MAATVTKSGELLLTSVKGRLPREIANRLDAGQVREVTRGIYTENLVDPIASIANRRIWTIVAHLVPGAVVDFRTGILGRPHDDGTVFLSYKYPRTIDDVPGLAIKLIKGSEPLEGDQRFHESLFWASEARGWLNVMSPSRARHGVAKGFTDDEAFERIERIIRTRGVDGPRGLNKLRDEARTLNQAMGLHEEFRRLNRLIATALNTHQESGRRTNRQVRSAVSDRERIRLFQLLRDALLEHEVEGMYVGRQTPDFRQNLAFFESYFSNFIEGTEFLVDEAKEIVYENRVIPNRVDDSHDILGTFRIVSDINEMQKTPATGAEFIELLRNRHAVALPSRLDKNPGEFKTRLNRAGSTLFVLPELVAGTLAEGFDLASGLQEPLSRAIYMMFLVAEVHPFADGNGRIARIMMNAELQAAGQMRVIVPTVSREDYLLGLRNLSRNSEPMPLARLLVGLQRFANSIPFENLETAQQQLEIANAFSDPDEGKLKFV